MPPTPLFVIPAKAGTQRKQEMSDKFLRHKQPWTSDEIQKLHRLAGKGMSLKALSKALTRSEESIQARARQDGLKVLKLR